MITKLTISNYKSLGPDVVMPLGPLSILVGPNGSGKSNALDALSFVRDAVLRGLPVAVTDRGGINSIRRRSHGHPYNVSVALEVALANGTAKYAFEITGDKIEEYRVKSESALVNVGGKPHNFSRSGEQWSGASGYAPRRDREALELTALAGDARFKPLADFFGGMCVYSIFPDRLRPPQNFDATRPMKSHGENWVSALRELLKHEDDKKELIAGLKKLTGDIENVVVKRVSDYLVAQFLQQVQQETNRRKKWFEAGQQSDGTLRVAGLLTALLQQPAVPLIGVEEPELTVHPGVLPMLYEYLKQASKTSQVVITTHSPIVLDVADAKEDGIFVAERRDGKTSIQRVSEEQLKPVRDGLLTLGELYLCGDLQLPLDLES